MKPLMTHFRLQLTVDPEAREDGKVVHESKVGFTVESDHPGLVRHVISSFRTPYPPLVLHGVHIHLFNQPLPFLFGGSGLGGVEKGVQLRVPDSV